MDGWSPEAVCDGHTAASRAAWLQQHRGWTLQRAQHSVMTEFPAQFASALGEAAIGGNVTELVGAVGEGGGLGGCGGAWGQQVTPADAALMVWHDEFQYKGQPDPSR